MKTRIGMTFRALYGEGSSCAWLRFRGKLYWSHDDVKNPYFRRCTDDCIADQIWAELMGLA